jgi:hypothetical protein
MKRDAIGGNLLEKQLKPAKPGSRVFSFHVGPLSYKLTN